MVPRPGHPKETRRMLDEILLILSHFGGGPGGPNAVVVRFLLAAFFWTVLFFISRGQWKRSGEERDFLVSVAAFVGAAREVVMWLAEYGSFRGWLSYPTVFHFYPPFEHAATMISVVVAAYAFLRYHLPWKRFAVRYLQAGLTLSVLLYLVTAPTWIRFLDDVLARTGTWAPFGSFAGDLLFRVAAVALYSFHMGAFIAGRRRGFSVPAVTFAAFAFFYLDDFLMIINLLQKEAHVAVFAPIRHNLHLWAGALLTGVYWADIRRRIEALEITQRRTFELSPDVLGAADRAGRITLGSHAALKILGRDPADIVGMNIRDFGLSADREGHGTALAAGETLYRHPDGSDRWLTWDIRPAGDDPLAYFVITDATERHRAEAELARQNEELRRIDRIRDGLVRDVSHELKTPVAKQAMQIDILRAFLEKRGLLGDAAGILAVMEGSVRRQDAVIRNILDLARLSAGGRKSSFAPTLLDRLAREILDEYRLDLETYRIVATVRAQPVEVTTDREMLGHVLSNLIGNAIKFRSAADPVIEVTVTARGEEAEMTVRDNGIGLSPEELERAFDRFFKAVPSTEGGGVGLTIARMITEALGGTISLDSAGPGRGVSVTIRLPRGGPRS
jgi:PAS domain S-box-containing protein